MKWYKLSGCVLAATLASCAPADEDKPADTNTPAFLLTGGSVKTWRLSSVKFDGKDSTLADCDRDNTYRFRVNDSLRHDAGTAHCADEPPTFDGTWRLQNSDKYLFIEGASFNETYQVDRLKSDTLELSLPANGRRRTEVYKPAG